MGLRIAFGFVVGWQTLYERLRIPDPYDGRREVASATVQMFEANPWKGFGLGTWTNVYPAYASKDFGVFINAAHNDWLQSGAEVGIPVLACLFLLFGASIFLVRKAPGALGVPIVFLHSLIDFPMQGRFLPAIVLLVLGIAVRSVLTKARHAPPFRAGKDVAPACVCARASKHELSIPPLAALVSAWAAKPQAA
jgi:O-antigen ligase